jgi:uncharacterized protein (DUF1697 family)
MNYVALLRGINVGGNNKVDMVRLKVVFERVGMRSVRTYINSGNVVFENGNEKDTTLTAMLEQAIEKEFGFPVSVLVKSEVEVRMAVEATPREWRNDKTMKCDVVFLWDGVNVETALSQLRARDRIDEVRTAPGIIIWKVDRENATKNGLLKMAGTPLYKQVTIRNINTTRKLLQIMEEKY